MIILASETSTLLGSVALLEDDKVLAYKELLRQGSHSDVLNLFIEDVLKKSGKTLPDVDLFASGIGPGSFTGIRIALNAMKTFSYCYNKPVIGINSLKTLAETCEDFNGLPIVAMINAYKNMVYIATFKKDSANLVTLREPEVVRVQNLEAYITESCTVVGDGFLSYEKHFSSTLRSKMQRPSLPQDEPNAQGLGQLAFRGAEKIGHWSELMPVYLRASEAEENLQGIKYQALP